MKPLTTRINGGVRTYLHHARLFLAEPRVLIALAVVAAGDVLLLVATAPSAVLYVLVWSWLSVIVFGLLMIKGTIPAEEAAGAQNADADAIGICGCGDVLTKDRPVCLGCEEADYDESAEGRAEPAVEEESSESLEEIMQEFKGACARLWDPDNDEPLAERLDVARAAADRAIAKFDENEGEKT